MPTSYCNPTPVPPLVPVCDDPEFCEELHLTKCVKYTGDPLANLEVQDGDRLDSILTKIDEKVGEGADIDGIIRSGLHTTSASGSTTTFIISHGLGVVPGSIQITPATADAANPFYVAATTNNINVIYKSAPPAGTANIRLYWMVKS